LQTWVPLTDEYCAEALRREGRGSERVYAKCVGVSCVDPTRQCANRACTGVPEYRCSDGVCFGEVMRCATCIVAAHAQLPTHFIEVCWFLVHFCGNAELTKLEMEWEILHAVSNGIARPRLARATGAPPWCHLSSEKACPAGFCPLRPHGGPRNKCRFLWLQRPGGVANPATPRLLVAGDGESAQHLRNVRRLKAISTFELSRQTFCLRFHSRFGNDDQP
jgi:hypothetical protein